MSERRLTLEELNRTANFVYQVMAPTPQYAWPKLRNRVGCTVWVKHENHTPTGAFKVRGGLVYMERLVRSRPRIKGVVSATRGNHGQSISFAAARAGIPATIYVPHGNSPDQNTSMGSFGAQVVEFGKDFDEAKHEAHRVAAAENLHFIPSFHWDLVAGVASYALELFRAVEKLDAVYVGVGMGSGICALITVRDLLGLKTEIIGVSAVNAPASALSFEAGKPVTTPTASTFADGIATREPVADVVEIIHRGAARFVKVSEDEMAEAMRVYYGPGGLDVAERIRRRIDQPKLAPMLFRIDVEQHVITKLSERVGLQVERQRRTAHDLRDVAAIAIAHP
jgi:threonine dehydratase